MKKIKTNIILVLALLISSLCGFSQTNESKIEDKLVKEKIYAQYKNQVRAYSRKDFDDLFFEFFKESNSKSKTLTKEEYYSYTIKIAIYSEKQGLLYKNKKEEATSTKEEWFSKNYSDYLATKNPEN